MSGSAAPRHGWLSRRPWVRHGSLLWALLATFDAIDWIVLQAARVAEGVIRRVL